MPFKIRKEGDFFKVVNDRTGRVLGTHKTRQRAIEQLRAVAANLPASQFEGEAAHPGRS